MKAGNILCATDLTEASDRALELGMLFARVLGRELTLLHVTEPQELPADAPDSIRKTAEGLHKKQLEGLGVLGQSLQRQQQRCVDNGVTVEVLVREGKPWTVIAELADEEDASLIVLGAGPAVEQGPGKWAQRLLGTTADRTVRLAPCPSLVATGTEALTYRDDTRWLVGVDFSEGSAKALQTVQGLVQKAGGTVTVTHVIPPAGHDELEDSERSWKELLREQSKQEAAQKLSKLAAEHAPDAEVMQRLSYGTPASELCELGQEMEADFLAVGTRGPASKLRPLLGSQAEKTLRIAAVPVLLVPPDGK